MDKKDPEETQVDSFLVHAVHNHFGKVAGVSFFTFFWIDPLFKYLTEPEKLLKATLFWIAISTVVGLIMGLVSKGAKKNDEELEHRLGGMQDEDVKEITPQELFSKVNNSSDLSEESKQPRSLYPGYVKWSRVEEDDIENYCFIQHVFFYPKWHYVYAFEKLEKCHQVIRDSWHLSSGREKILLDTPISVHKTIPKEIIATEGNKIWRAWQPGYGWSRKSRQVLISNGLLEWQLRANRIFRISLLRDHKTVAFFGPFNLYISKQATSDDATAAMWCFVQQFPNWTTGYWRRFHTIGGSIYRSSWD